MTDETELQYLEDPEVALAQKRRRRRWLLGTFALIIVAAGGGWINHHLSQRSPSPSLSPTEYYEQALAFLAKEDYPSAQIELKNTLVAEPDNVDARVQLGLVALKLGDGLSAEKELELAKQKGADSPEIEIGLVRAKFLQGRFDEALSGLVFVPENPQTRALRGEILLELDRLDESQELFQSLLAQNPNDIVALNALARISMAKGDLLAAEQSVGSALGVSENNFSTWLLKADLAFGKADYEGAKVAYERALSLHGNHVRAKIALTQTLLALGDVEGAEPHLEVLARASPDAPVVNYLRAVSAELRGDLEQAKTQLRAVLAIGPHRESLFRLSSIQFRQNDLEDAEVTIRQLLASSPTHLQSNKLLAAIKIARKQAKEAAEILNIRLADAPNDVQLLSMLGHAYMLDGRLDKANEVLAKAAELDPDGENIKTQQAMNRFALGETDQALQDLGAVVDANPDYLQAELISVAMHLQRKDYPQVIAAAQGVLQKQPQNALLHHLIGTAHEQLGDRGSAVESYERALEVNSRFVAPAMSLARLHLVAGDEAGGRARYDALLQHTPEQPDSLMGLAELEFRSGNVDEGLLLLQRARQHNPGHLTSRLALVTALLQLGKPSEALTPAEEAFRIAPEVPATVLALNSAQVANGNAGVSLPQVLVLADKHPDSVDVHAELARTYLAMGNLNEARQTFQHVLELDANHLGAKLGLGRVALASGAPQTALKIARSMQSSAPENPEGFSMEGDAHIVAGDPAAAIAPYKAALALAGRSRIVIALSNAHRAAGNASAAEQTLRQWLEAHPDDVIVRMVVAALLLESKDFDGAIAQYESIIERDPDNAPALNNLAYFYQRKQDPRALKMAKKAHQLAPDDPGISDTYGWLLVESGEVETGLRLLKESAAKIPESTELQYHLGAALYLADQKEEARKVLLALVETREEFPEKQKVQELLELIQ